MVAGATRASTCLHGDLKIRISDVIANCILYVRCRCCVNAGLHRIKRHYLKNILRELLTE